MSDHIDSYDSRRFTDEALEHKITELIENMSLEDKIGQITESWGVRGNERLGIPPLYKSETVHGNSYGTGTTVFPHAIALAAAWDRDIMRRVGETTARETLSAGALQGWSPLLDVARDPRWGRVEESFGEDPALVEKLGCAWIDGFQSLGMTATPKHFAGHGAPLGGRDSNDYGFSEREFRTTHFPSFRAAVKYHGVMSIMSAYHCVDGTPATGSDKLLNTILRGEWGFEGYVVSDVGAPENLLKKLSVCGDEAETASLLLRGGVDLCAPGDIYSKGIPTALERGLITEKDVDKAVRNILRVKYRLGAFDKRLEKQLWENVPGWNAAEHRELAREAAEKSAVLLKNDGILPLDGSVKAVSSLAVIGPAAFSCELGDYSGKLREDQKVTIAEGIKRCFPEATINEAVGCGFTDDSDDGSGIAPAVSAALSSDVVVLCVGDKSEKTTGENNDRASCELTGRQPELVRAILDTGKPVIVVVAVGRPTAMEEAFEKASAVLVTWYCGEEAGSAAARLISGEAVPEGKLPMTFPKSTNQLPLYYSYLMSGRGYDYSDIDSVPRRRFGYGLSYTSFEYSFPSASVDDDGRVDVRCRVKNTGSRRGRETVQLYVTDVVSSVNTPVTSLKDFIKLELEPGEEKTAEFSLTPYDISLLDAGMRRVAEKGLFRVFIGGTSPYCDTGNDERKKRIGYASASEGVCCEFELKEDIRADFDLKISRDEGVSVYASNRGGLCDVLSMTLFIDGVTAAKRSCELEPGEDTTIRFEGVTDGDALLLANDRIYRITKT
ncbi:MAG: glycoside hydrolase family 3 C-terminal domain-containing protein [Clostridiales bacterium]|nr:glycoside hydrolase family 3 C-terminal domain-containing protein [Clostridiales bacterium]